MVWQEKNQDPRGSLWQGSASTIREEALGELRPFWWWGKEKGHPVLLCSEWEKLQGQWVVPLCSHYKLVE